MLGLALDRELYEPLSHLSKVEYGKGREHVVFHWLSELQWLIKLSSECQSWSCESGRAGLCKFEAGEKEEEGKRKKEDNQTFFSCSESAD